MPQVFKIAGYTVYFWVNENDPLEPVHVHIAKGVPSPNATKIWITKNGKCLLCNNNSKIPDKHRQKPLGLRHVGGTADNADHFINMIQGDQQSL